MRPLTPTEWGRLATWLRDRNLLPENLLAEGSPTILSDLKDKTISIERIKSLLDRGITLGVLVERWSRAGLWVMTRADTDYPSRLKKKLGAISPAVLFGSGNRALLDKGGLAVVGSRRANPEDRAYSRALGALAALSGHSIVSGGARGIDEEAMLGALNAEGTAIGVLANDLLRASTSSAYREHLERNNLVLISTTHPEAGFDVGMAMQRNKYIYCLAEAAVVVNSGKKGGTWTGAQENLRKGWTPLWVKDSSDPEAGNQVLLEHPATKQLPGDLDTFSFGTFFVDETAPHGPLPSLFDKLPTADEKASAMENTFKFHHPEEASASRLDSTFFDLFLSKMRDYYFDTPVSVQQIQAQLNLQRAQLNVWLKEAVEEGHLIKLTNPVRYQFNKQKTLLPKY